MCPPASLNSTLRHASSSAAPSSRAALTGTSPPPQHDGSRRRAALAADGLPPVLFVIRGRRFDAKPEKNVVWFERTPRSVGPTPPDCAAVSAHPEEIRCLLQGASDGTGGLWAVGVRTEAGSTVSATEWAVTAAEPVVHGVAGCADPVDPSSAGTHTLLLAAGGYDILSVSGRAVHTIAYPPSRVSMLNAFPYCGAGSVTLAGRDIPLSTSSLTWTWAGEAREALIRPQRAPSCPVVAVAADQAALACLPNQTAAVFPPAPPVQKWTVGVSRTANATAFFYEEPRPGSAPVLRSVAGQVVLAGLPEGIREAIELVVNGSADSDSAPDDSDDEAPAPGAPPLASHGGVVTLRGDNLHPVPGENAVDVFLAEVISPDDPALERRLSGFASLQFAAGSAPANSTKRPSNAGRWSVEATCTPVYSQDPAPDGGASWLNPPSPSELRCVLMMSVVFIPDADEEAVDTTVNNS
eukprot:gene22380-34271_t